MDRKVHTRRSPVNSCTILIPAGLPYGTHGTFATCHLINTDSTGRADMTICSMKGWLRLGIV